MPRMAIKVVAFDVYETLARWPAGRVQSIEVQQILGRFGIEISYQAYEAARQSVLFFDAVKRRIEGWTDWFALVFARMGVMISTDLLADLTALHEARCRMEVFADAIPAIEAARAAGLRTCAFTTLPEFFLVHGGNEVRKRLDDYFDGAAVGYPKGHPAYYRRIPEFLGVMPGEILAVGDDPICDVALPREAGWQAVQMDRKNVRANDASNIIQGLTQLNGLY